MHLGAAIGGGEQQVQRASSPPLCRCNRQQSRQKTYIQYPQIRSIKRRINIGRFPSHTSLTNNIQTTYSIYWDDLNQTIVLPIKSTNSTTWKNLESRIRYQTSSLNVFCFFKTKEDDFRKPFF